MIVPDGDPGEFLVGEEEIEVGAVGCEAASVVVESEDFAFGLDGASCCGCGVFVDVIAELGERSVCIKEEEKDDKC